MARVLTCGMLQKVTNADDHLSDPELAVLRYILDRWGVPLESLYQELLQEKRRAFVPEAPGRVVRRGRNSAEVAGFQGAP